MTRSSTARKRRRERREHYQALAKELRKYTTVDYSKKSRLKLADKQALTRAANTLSRGTFVPLPRKPKERPKDYSKRVKDYQRSHGLPVNGTIRGVVADLPDEAIRPRATKDGFTFDLPAKRSKFGGRKKLKYRTVEGYRIRVRRDKYGDALPISKRVRDGIRKAAKTALKGRKRPTELFARIARKGGGARVNVRRVIYDDADIEDFLSEIAERIEDYEIGGTLVITSRSNQ